MLVAWNAVEPGLGTLMVARERIRDGSRSRREGFEAGRIGPARGAASASASEAEDGALSSGGSINGWP